VTRRIYPVIAIVTDDGFRRLSEEEAGEVVKTVVDGRMRSPDGPSAPLR
jgi:proteasome beta subunit